MKDERQISSDESLREIFSGHSKDFYVMLLGMALMVCALPALLISDIVSSIIFGTGGLLAIGAMGVALNPWAKANRSE